MLFSRFGLKRHLAIGSVAEFSQSGKGGFLASPQIGQNLVEYAVQAVGRFCLANPRPPSQLLCDVRLPHFAINGIRRFARVNLPRSADFHKQLKTRLLLD